jgi:hydroxypyruvate reductase
MPVRCVAAPELLESVLGELRTRFDSVGGERHATAEEAVALCREHRADALLTAHRHRLDAALIESLPDHVKIVATMAAGTDHIDVEAARRRGLIVTNTPGMVADSSADLAMGLILACSRRFGEAHTLMHNGWRRDFAMGEFLGRSLQGKQLGIFGMGRIGRALAHRARAFGMRIAYCNRHRLSLDLEQGARHFPVLSDMLPACDVLVLCAPGTPATEGIIDASALSLLPKDAILVNIGRGSLVDEEALISVMETGHLFAAALDVFRREPDFDMRLARIPNLFLTPHIGSQTLETRHAMGVRAMDNIEAVCGGEPPLDPV